MPVMPDTRIPLSAASDASPSSGPLQTLGALMKIKESQQDYRAREMENEKRRRDLEDDDLITMSLQRHDRPEDAMDELLKNGHSTSYAKLAKDTYNSRTAALQAQEAQLKVTDQRLGLATQAAGNVHDDATYQAARPNLVKILQPTYGNAIEDMLPTTYDKAKIDALIAAGTSRRDQLQTSQNLIENVHRAYGAGLASANDVANADPNFKAGPDTPQYSANALKAHEEYQQAQANVMVNAQNKEEWDRSRQLAYDHGFPKVVMDRFGEWDEHFQPTYPGEPNPAVVRARNLGMSLRERAAAEAASRNAGASEYRADTADLRARTAETRANTAEARAEAAATARAARDAARGQRTEGQKDKAEDGVAKDIAATDKWVKENYDGTGDFAYERLSDATKKEYIRRRVDSENKSRVRVQGLPPIEQAAKEAIAKKDVAGYNKLRDVYSAITNKLGDLETIAPWPDRNKGVLTPEAQAERRNRIRPILEKLKDPTLTPAERKALETQRDDLLNASR